MKFSFTTEINQPINRVVELFLNKSNLKEWQKELVNFEYIRGTPNEIGSVSKIVYKSVIIFETILSKNLPNEIKAEYEHKRGNNTVMVHQATNRFSALGENKTFFELEMEYTRFVGFLPKLMSKLMGGAFKKYYQKQVEQFRIFSETRTTEP